MNVADWKKLDGPELYSFELFQRNCPNVPGAAGAAAGAAASAVCIYVGALSPKVGASRPRRST